MPWELTIERTFPAAHQLRFPDGSLEPLHAHEWRVRVVIASDQLDEMDCVMDFHVLEAELDSILHPYRHANLNDRPPFSTGTQSSAERVAETIGRSLLDVRAIPGHARLLAVHVTESAGCVATWRA